MPPFAGAVKSIDDLCDLIDGYVEPIDDLCDPIGGFAAPIDASANKKSPEGGFMQTAPATAGGRSRWRRHRVPAAGPGEARAQVLAQVLQLRGQLRDRLIATLEQAHCLSFELRSEPLSFHSTPPGLSPLSWCL